MTELVATLAALLADAAGRLAAAGVPAPRRNALRLWADLNATEPARAWLVREHEVAPSDAARFLDAVARRAAGEPLAYVSGVVGFRRLTLEIDRRALIPRPETEGLVGLVLTRVPGGSVADVGTGSGCIALSLAVEGSYERIVAVDRSGGALSLAAHNARRAGIRRMARPGGPSPVSFVRGDLTGALVTSGLDAVVSNPPYLTTAEYAAVDDAVRAWEPRDALVGGADGLDAVRGLAHDAHRVVRAGGWLALEVDSTRAAAAASLVVRAGWTDVTVGMDLFGRERYLLARRSDGP